MTSGEEDFALLRDRYLTSITRILVDDDVYDLTKFQEEHPGGQKSEDPPRQNFQSNSH